MPKVFSFLLLLSLLANGCKRCTTCTNSCKQCVDKNFSIKVCSDKLTYKYYNEYIDSLTAPTLGWSCADIPSDSTYRLCKASQFKSEKRMAEERGFSCKE